MIKLSDHFTLEEMTRSGSAVSMGIKNVPHKKHIENLRALCEQVLEPLREHMGRPLHINSGYRCPELNTAVGGATFSQHMLGQAADVACKDLNESIKMAEFIASELVFDQCFVETDGRSYWVHVSYRGDKENRCIGWRMQVKK